MWSGFFVIIFHLFATIGRAGLSRSDQNRRTTIENIFGSSDKKNWNANQTKNHGAGGHRSRCLSHAKRALYHLSYSPVQTKIKKNEKNHASTFSKNQHTLFLCYFFHSGKNNQIKKQLYKQKCHQVHAHLARTPQNLPIDAEFNSASIGCGPGSS